MQDDLSYDAWTTMLGQAGVALGASEAHGLLAGLACAGTLDCGAAIAALGASEDDGELRDALEGVCELLTQALAETGVGLEPLLPDDGLPSVQRSRALTEWCSGFVTGFHWHDRGREASEYPEIAAEALADIGDLAKARGTVGEADLTEIVEYLRVAVQLIYEEVAD